MRRSKLKLGSAAFAVAGRLMKIEERGGEEEEVLMRRARWMVFVLLALSFILMPMEEAWAQIFPIPPNVAVATCEARPTDMRSQSITRAAAGPNDRLSVQKDLKIMQTADCRLPLPPPSLPQRLHPFPLMASIASISRLRQH